MLCSEYNVLSVCCAWCILYTAYAVLWTYCTQCIQYSVHPVLCVHCTLCMLYSAYGVLQVCSTLGLMYSVFCCSQCILCSVYAVLRLCYTECWHMTMAWGDSAGWLNFMCSREGRVDSEKERNKKTWGKSSWETGTTENFVRTAIDHPICGRYDSGSGMLTMQCVILHTQPA